MGIYDKGTGFDPKTIMQRVQKFLPIIVGALALAIVVWLLYSIFVPQTISFSFNKNPIKQSEQAVLSVRITNTLGKTTRNVTVEVFAEDKKSISVVPPLKKIEVLDQYRELEFVINPVGEVLPGNYLLNIKANISEQIFQTQAAVGIEKQN